MAFLAYKLLTYLSMPLSIGMLGGLAALAAILLDRRRLAGVLLGLALGWLWFWSTPIVANALMVRITAPYPSQRAEALPNADVIMVLGGRTFSSDGSQVYPDLGADADRVWHAARLYRAGKADRIILAGGRVWPTPGQPSAGRAAEEFLNLLGVSDRAIWIEARSRNTRESLREAARLMNHPSFGGGGEVLLVTSAWHMRRALALSSEAGLRAVSAPTDHEDPWPSAGAPRILQLIPSVAALETSTRVGRECLALAVDWLRRWF